MGNYRIAADNSTIRKLNLCRLKVSLQENMFFKQLLSHEFKTKINS